MWVFNFASQVCLSADEWDWHTPADRVLIDPLEPFRQLFEAFRLVHCIAEHYVRELLLNPDQIFRITCSCQVYKDQADCLIIELILFLLLFYKVGPQGFRIWPLRAVSHQAIDQGCLANFDITNHQNSALSHLRGLPYQRLLLVCICICSIWGVPTLRPAASHLIFSVASRMAFLVCFFNVNY